MFSNALQVVFSSLTLGSTYALVAMGLVLIFKATDLINFGQGDWVLAGAYVALTMLFWNLPLWAVFILAPIVGAGLGALIDLGIFRRISKSGGWVFVLMAIAVGGLLKELAHFRYEAHIFRFPTFFSRDRIEIFGAFTTPHNLWVVACSGLVVLGLWLFFEQTNLGRATKGLAENRVGAAIVGINVRAMLTLVFALSFTVSTFAGMLVAPQIGVHPEMDLVIVKAFVAAALGGLDRLSGAVAAGFMVAIAETLTNIYITSTYKDVVVFSILLLVLWQKPSGLFNREVAKRV